ncbi:hypothetical protein SISSUDRAFT_816117 [Sistotremastrum suecicum HHB10207 ss-3]|uniref:Uncharacterized protein n=1 Tax=Sistotremastrum suecicum HHB10207 ss-3 TaxID=1314776 RepID=A0A166CUL3_9AGAM|nr:hypothetical protein SISSUDRAFT_816117 [Sistotremastrum suecicum HHB10207 ss-3]
MIMRLSKRSESSSLFIIFMVFTLMYITIEPYQLISNQILHRHTRTKISNNQFHAIALGTYNREKRHVCRRSNLAPKAKKSSEEV